MTPACKICLGSLSGCSSISKWSYEIVRCPHCGTGATLLEDPGAVATIYKEDYFSGGRKDGYQNYALSEPVLKREFRSTLDFLAQRNIKSGRLLEIGTAYGFFLLEASRQFECEGIELVPEAAAAARSRGLRVTTGNVAELPLANGSYDVVVMLDTIEHLVDPRAVLTRCSGTLKKGGAILITTGDWGSWFSRLCGKYWRLLTPPQHLFFFTESSLTRLLSETGFTVQAVRHPWKKVPLGLGLFQLSQRLGFPFKSPVWMNRIEIPVNFFDAMCVLAIKQ